MNRRYSTGGGGKSSYSKGFGCFVCYAKTLAFTLAETLIVMGIIGVVAALTLPNLNSSTGDKEKVVKVKKIYQNLNDAFGRAEAVYGPVDTWGDSGSRSFERILDFMKYSKKCDTVTSCAIEFGKNGSAFDSSTAAVLADGSVIAFDRIGSNYGRFTIDLDGVQKGPNKQGYDIFRFYISHKDGVYVEKYADSAYVQIKEFSNGNGKGFSECAAAAWIINFDNMDYLKTTDGTTCPNGTKLTFGGNHSCK